MSKTRATHRSHASRLMGLMGAAGLVAILGLGFFPAYGEAQVNCGTVPAGSTTDTDADGFTDEQECKGIGVAGSPFVFATGLSTLVGGAFTTSLPTCAAGSVRANCLDPNTEDFFVVITRATTAPTPTGSWIPPNPTQFISQALSQGGLAITVHELAEAANVTGDRLVLAAGSTQHYLTVTESLTPATDTDTALGVANQGSVNSPFAFATVFTQRIVDYHASVYASKGQAAPAAERDTYILHTVAHETSHNLDLCGCPSNPRYGGRHYRTGTLVVMEQSVKVTVQGTTVTFFIAEDYPAADQANPVLVP